MESQSLRAFIVEAHRNGYSATDAVETSAGIKRIEFERGDWTYIDQYAGSRDFIGFEIVQYEGELVWGMNYCGYVTIDSANEDDVYGFLREALGRVSEGHPFRGPPFEQERFEYEADSTGDVDRFHGSEEIRRSGETVYIGHYRGGRAG